ncbi:MAG TPA: dihydropteroate synthase [Longilinea sp.]|nr:dihydropteroate synthase [Longilinea sp.]
MLIIGEKLNGMLKDTSAAIKARDAALIQLLAQQQVKAGAEYLDVNAVTGSGNEVEDLIWLVETIQATVDVPLCIDSADSVALKAGVERATHTPMVNSINGDEKRLADLLPLVAKKGSPVIALLLNDSSIPEDVKGRVVIGRYILECTRRAGIPDQNVYLDPLVMAIGTQDKAAVLVLDTIRAIQSEFPEVKTIVGLGNISYGLPCCALINQAFFAQLIAAGLDAAIINPLDQGMINTLYATELILGNDHNCRKYLTAFRAGKVKPDIPESGSE